MSGISISFDGRDPAETVLAKVDAAVAAGVGSIWLACHLFQRDPITTASVLLGRHPQLRIVLVALSPYVIHPVHMAMTAATLEEFYPGRISLCLGVGAPADLASIGINTPGPLGTMREALNMCRQLFTGETVRLEGRQFRIAGRALASGPHDIPLILAASGPKMLRLSATHADGVLLSAGTSPEYVEWSLDQVAAGGPPAHFRRCGLIYASVDKDEAVACDRLRRVLATVLRGRHHARNLELANSRLNQAAVNAAWEAGDIAAAEALIDDEIVGRHAAAGAPAAFKSRIAGYREAGLDDAVLASMRTPEEIAAVVSVLNTTS